MIDGIRFMATLLLQLLSTVEVRRRVGDVVPAVHGRVEIFRAEVDAGRGGVPSIGDDEANVGVMKGLDHEANDDACAWFYALLIEITNILQKTIH